MSKYDLNIRKLIVQMLPMHLRGNLVDLIETLVQPLKRLYYQFSVFKDNENQLLSYNSQVRRLEGLLNTTFAPRVWDVYIEDAPHNAIDGVWENAEHKPKEIGFWGLLGKDEFAYNGFVVYVPYRLRNEEKRIKLLVDKYKFPGTTYKIEIY